MQASQLNQFGNGAEFQTLQIKAVKIAKYQKRLNKERVASIVKDFDPNRMRPIELSYRDGQYFCYDGQHRLAAYIEMGFTAIPAMVRYGLSYEDEAYLFARQQDNVGSVTTRHKWNALREAGDHTVKRIVETAIKHGYVVGGSNPSGRNIQAVKTLQTIASENGMDGLDKVLSVTRKCWNGARHSTSVEILSGLALFFKAHGRESNFSLERLHNTLEVVDPSAVLRLASTKNGMNQKVRVAKALEDMYNKKSRKSNRLTRPIDERGRCYA